MSLPILIISGPTSIGKSNLAIKLAIKYNAEIINADSMQVYSNLNVLTARPSIEEMSIVPHYLYGHISGSKRYNVANWCEDASKIIKKNNKKNILNIVVGGTGLYIEKILNGLISVPSIPEFIKKESEDLINKIGIENFYNKIKEIDPTALKKISKNDNSRLRRIWEVYKFTNNNMTFWLNNKNKKYLSGLDYKLVLFQPEKKMIYERINKRFVNMIQNGAIEEVKKLRGLNLENSLPIMRAHGVPEIIKYLSNNISLDECIQKGQQITRNYAKRQLTWWRSSKLEIHANFDKFPSETDPNSLVFL